MKTPEEGQRALPLVREGSHRRFLRYRLERAATQLTPREREIIGWAGAGLPDRAIADGLGVSVQTVKNHLQSAYRKLHVHGRAAAARVLALAAALVLVLGFSLL